MIGLPTDEAIWDSKGVRDGRLLQRKFGCGGTCPSCRAVGSAGGGLAIVGANDRSELEADRVADRFAKGSLSGAPGKSEAASGYLPTVRSHNGGSEVASPNGGEPLPESVRRGFEARMGYDFSKVRVHTDAQAAASARALNARAYTVGRNVVFGAGQFAPETQAGRHLLAHELTHVIQQRHTGPAVQRQLLEGPAATEAMSGPWLDDPDAGSVEIPLASQPTDDEIIDRVRDLGHNLDSLVQLINSELEFSGGGVDSEAAWFARGWLRRTRETANEITAGGLERSAAKLNEYTEEIEQVLVYLERVISSWTRNGENTGVLEFMASERAQLAAKTRSLLQSDFLQRGKQEIRIETEQRRETAIIAGKIERIEDYVRRQESTAGAVALHGTMIARILVRDEPILSADQVRQTLLTLESVNPEVYDQALYEGLTVQNLHDMGIGGLQAFVHEEEGFISGLVRGEGESLLADPAGERAFSVTEQATAAAGGVAGFFQGVGDSIIDNIKGIIELFTPSFWRDLKAFLTDFLPDFAMDNGFRFLIGQMMGQASAEELRRLSVADPFEYGRTIGHAIGFALTETVLSFIGLGWVLKSLKGTRILAKMSDSIMVVVRRVARSALAVKAFNIAQVIGEGLNALRERMHRLQRRLPAVTAAGRMDRAVAEFQDAERMAMRIYNEAVDAEQAAQRALSNGEYEEAQEHLQTMSRKLDELEPHAFGNRTELEAPEGGAPTAPTPNTEAAERASASVGGVNKETRELLAENDAMREAVEKYPAAARAFKHCASSCLPPIPPATVDDYARYDRLLRIANSEGITFDPKLLGKYFHSQRDNLPSALDLFEEKLFESIDEPGDLTQQLIADMEEVRSAAHGAERARRRAEVFNDTSLTRTPNPKDPTDAASRGLEGEVARAAEVGREYRSITEVIKSPTKRKQMRAQLNDPNVDYTLLDFANELGPDGAGHVKLMGKGDEFRYIDHVFAEGNRVVLRESKDVDTFTPKTRILKQLRIDQDILAKHPEAIVRWRVTVREADVDAEFISQLQAIQDRWSGRFIFEFNP